MKIKNIRTRVFINTIQDFCTYHNNFKETYVLASLEIFFACEIYDINLVIQTKFEPKTWNHLHSSKSTKNSATTIEF